MRPTQPRFAVWRILPFLGGLLLALLVGIHFGAVQLSLSEIWQGLTGAAAGAQIETILWQIRLPRVVLAACVGAGLAVAGAAFQGVFRNPLADPFVIGASSGAALGATLALLCLAGSVTVITSTGQVPWLILAAFGGAMLIVGAVFVIAALSNLGRSAPLLTLILAGMALSSFTGALVSLIMFLNHEMLNTIFNWLLGSFSGRHWNEIAIAGPVILVSGGLLWMLSRPLDLLSFGDETAMSLGLPSGKVRLLILAAATLCTAACVSVSGVIGFLGLMAPHMTRILLGPRHGLLIPGSALLGAILLVIADTLARTVIAPTEIPVGVVTALMGCPFFLFLLISRGRQTM
ncbi:FecCD family ABC transporter permease [Gimesia panareensis]|uniref:Hemin transport system permease protein HmuU n=1 Tax=Gimesia panareensis TaxID=2527978 RepID=A0A518FPH3_9PLAN|nr:iron ABC transporter permease [Gimesia panareensis]QDT25656.1 Hemin transport system permease protein HmuU [Gimesia panareensis]QDU48601.1 Hemin transport system permease protein HmuU [Gimesia panareensis]QDV18246.1 Hemin transport system permease protein HmuU [Gimesia panareensis]